jgi:phosphomannomutase
MFKDYDIRGIYPKEINESVAIFLTKKFLSYLNKVKKYNNCLLIAQDIRNSSFKIVNTIISYLEKNKLKYSFWGIIPTPVFYYFCLRNKLPGIMITASHLPIKYNGFKFFLPNNKIWIYKKNIKEENLEKENVFNLNIRYLYNEVYDNYLIYLKDFVNLKYLHTFYFQKNIKSTNNFLFKRIPKVFKNIRLNKNSSLLLFSDYDGDRLFIKYKGKYLISEEILFCILSSGLYKNIGLPLSIHKNIKKFFTDINFYTVKTGHNNIKNFYRKYNLDFALEPSGHFYFFKEVKTESPILAFFRLLEFIEKSENKEIKSSNLFPLKRFNTKDHSLIKKIKKYIIKNKFKIKKMDGLYGYKNFDKENYLGIHFRKSKTEKNLWRIFVESNNVKNIKNFMLKLKSQND